MYVAYMRTANRRVCRLPLPAPLRPIHTLPQSRFRYESAPVVDTAATCIYSTRNSDSVHPERSWSVTRVFPVPTPSTGMLLTLRLTSRRPPPPSFTLSAGKGEPLVMPVLEMGIQNSGA